ncbi:MAG: ribulose bisphosphate carboxylase small subunit, partial [Cyanobacteria bacterium J06627_28]
TGNPSEKVDATLSSPWKRARRSKVAQIPRSGEEKETLGGDTGSGNFRDADRLSADGYERVQSILATGCRLGIEHVDQRRFRTNSWQSYGTLNPDERSEAVDKVRACLSQFPDHYVRLIAIHPQTKQRLTEKIIHRPK